MSYLTAGNSGGIKLDQILEPMIMLIMMVMIMKMMTKMTDDI